MPTTLHTEIESDRRNGTTPTGTARPGFVSEPPTVCECPPRPREPQQPRRAPALRWPAAWAVSLLVILLPAGTVRGQATLYVDDDAPAGGDGSSWAAAFDDLQDALTVATGGGISRIHVAQGTYRPDEAGLDKDATFLLRNSLIIRGGYGGITAPNPDARDLQAYESVLNGKLQDDGPKHSRHVVTGSGTNSSAVLDGFTITGGRAVGGALDARSLSGGAMINITGSPTVIDCIFRENRAEFFGGGMANFGGRYPPPYIGSNPTLVRCSFERNAALANGAAGALSNFEYCSPILIDCTFTENTAGEGTGAMMNISRSHPLLVNCTFKGNWGVGPWGDAGAMFNGGECSPTMINCAFVGNRADATYANSHTGGGAIWMDNECTPLIINCSFSGNAAASSGGGIYNQYGHPILANCLFWGNTDQAGTNTDASAQIFNENDGDAVVSYSIVQDDAPGDGDVYPGLGNLDVDPTFVRNPDDGGDGWGVGFNDDYGDLHLQAGSPAIDAADNDAVPAYIATDLDSRPRFADDPNSPDVGNGPPPIVEMGVYEFDFDCNHNGIDDADDIANSTSTDSNGNSVPDECEACLTSAECDDGLFCNGVEFCAVGVCWNVPQPCAAELCNEADDVCDECTVDDDCDNSQFCDGPEACSGGNCVPGPPPCPDQFCIENNDRCVDCLDDAHCDDGAFCTGTEHCVADDCTSGEPPCGDLFCNETTDQCTGCLADADCDDDLFCTGTETCDGDACIPGDNPCPGLICIESTDTCAECTAHTDCSDGVFCNGSELCSGGSCLAGPPPCPDQLCDEIADRCADCLDHDLCDDDLFCTGTELCVSGTCSAGEPPCGELMCDEATEQCAACLADDDCDDGLFCNGAETCDGGTCLPGVYPCPGLACVEPTHACVACLVHADCDDGLFCNGIERCVAGACVEGDEPCSEYAPFCDEALNFCAMCQSSADCDDDNPCSTDLCLDGFCGYLPDPTCGGDDGGRFAADADRDGIADDDDLCPDTPVGERTNDRGCGCSQRDGDGDGVSDCNDLCPYTSSGDPIDEDGCSVPPPEAGLIDPADGDDAEGTVTIDVDPGTLETGGSADGDGPSSHLGEAEATTPEERPADDGSDASTRSAGQSTCGVLGLFPIVALGLSWFPLRSPKRSGRRH